MKLQKHLKNGGVGTYSILTTGKNVLYNIANYDRSGGSA
jgi:hypothetical protein